MQLFKRLLNILGQADCTHDRAGKPLLSDVQLVYNAHYGGVDSALLAAGGVARGGAGNIQHQLAYAGAYRIHHHLGRALRA